MKRRKNRWLSLILAAAVALPIIFRGLPTLTNATLLSIPTIHASIDIEDFTDEQLKTMSLQYIIDNMKVDRIDNYNPTIGVSQEDLTIGFSQTPYYKVIKPDDKFMWVSDDTYEPIDRNGTVNIYRDYYDYYYDNDSYDYYFGLLVGSGKQLDPDNIKCEISAHIKRKYKAEYDFDFYTYDENNQRKYLEKRSEKNENNSRSYDNREHYFDAINYVFDKDDKIYIEPKYTLINAASGTEVTVENVDISCENSESTDLGYLMSGYTNYRYDSIDFTYYLDGNVIYTETVAVYLDGNSFNESISFVDANNNYVSYSYSETNYSTIADNIIQRGLQLKLRNGYSVDADYKLSIDDLYYEYERSDLRKYAVKAVEGNYTSLEDAKDEPDIKETLLSNSWNWNNKGYTANFSKGVDFTVFIDMDKAQTSETDSPSDEETDQETLEPPKNLLIYILTVSVLESEPRPEPTINIPVVNGIDTWFNVENVTSMNPETGKEEMLNPFIVENSYDRTLDTYYGFGYQTLFVHNDSEVPLDMTRLKLNLRLDENVKLYNSAQSDLIELVKEPDYSYRYITKNAQDFSRGTVQYTLSTGTKTKNYFIRIAQNTTGGAKLYVNGPNEREIYLDDFFDNRHDILIANLGDKELTGLNVEWSEAPQNVKLDDYWTVGGEKNNTLAAFTTAEPGKMNNLAKVRLIPDGNGEISGTLKISADNQEPFYIKLTGHAGNPKIVTNSPLTEGVKFVPYFAIVATDNIHDWNTVSYKLMSGSLPSGVSFNESTGEIYGVPQEAGTFNITVRANFSNPNFKYSEKEFTVQILENTNMNVYNASDENYNIITPIGRELVGGQHDFRLYNNEKNVRFVSNGGYNEFIDLWLNGKKLKKDVDYTSNEGSTVINIMDQTIGQLIENEPNTIAAEFRVDGDLSKDLKRTAQNFIVQPFIEETAPPSILFPDFDLPPYTQPTVMDSEDTNIVNPDETDDEEQLTSDPESDTGELDESDEQETENEETEVTEKEPPEYEEDDDEDDTDTDVPEISDADDNSLNAGEIVLDENNSSVVITNEIGNYQQEDTSDTINDFGSQNSDTVTFTGSIVNAEGIAMPDLTVEVHSAVKTTVTDSSGYFELYNVEFGSHEFILKDADGNLLAEKTFTLLQDDTLSLNDNSIGAPSSSAFKLSIMYDNNDIKFLNIESVEDSDVYTDYDVPVPTGVELHGISLLFASAIFVGSFVVHKKKNKTK